MKNFIKKNKYYILAFIIPIFFLTLFFFLKYNQGNVSDLEEQYLLLYDYLKGIFSGSESLFYSFNRGIGGNMLGTFFYYLSSPFNILLAFVSKDMVFPVVIATCFVKIGLASVFMLYYLKKSTKNSDFINFIFALCYSVTAYGICSYDNPIWLDVFLLTPLIILGLDKILDNKRSFSYIIFLFLSILSSYYISYMLCIFLGIYFIFRLFAKYSIKTKKDRKVMKSVILKFIGHTILALLLAGVILLPMIYNTTQVIRENFKFDHSYIINIFNSLVQFSVIAKNGTSWDYVPHFFCGFFPLAILISYLLQNKGKERNIIIGVIFFFLLSLCVMPLVKVWHGFNYPHYLFHRWIFLFDFFIIVIAASKYKDIKELSLKHMGITSLVYGLVIFFSYLISNLENLNMFLVILNGLLLFLHLYLIKLLKFKNNKVPSIMLLILTLGTITLLFVYSFEEHDNNQILNKEYLEFYNGRESYQNQLNNLSDGFYRIGGYEKYTINETFNIKGRNQLFLSGNYKNIINFYKNAGFSTNMNLYYDNYNLNVLNKLLGVKYWYTGSKNTADLYGEDLEFVKKNQVYIYEDKDALSLGYLINYDDRIIAHENSLEYLNSFFRTIYGKNVYQKYILNKRLTKAQNIYIIVKDVVCEDDNMAYVNVNDSWKYFCSESIVESVKGNIISDMYTTKDKNRLLDMYTIDQDVVDEMLDYFKKRQINITNMEKNKLEFNIESNNDDTLMLTIPYDDAWSIYVDGKKADYFPIFNTFIGIRLDNGNHDIKMKYIPKYFFEGLTVSGITAIFLIIYYRKTKKTK